MAIAKNPKVIMTERQFVERLKNLANRKTFYKNKFPDNMCYIHSDGRTSADCVNLVKAILNGYNIYNNTIGYYQRPPYDNTGDCTEAQLLCQCSDVTDDFSKMGNKARILWMNKPNGHIGVYLGHEVEIDGKIYNSIECSKSWGGIVYSYVDSDGTRRRYKGAVKNCRWMKNGLPNKWVEFAKDEAMKPTQEEPKPTQSVYYVKRGDTLSSIAKANGMSLAKLVSLNPQIRDINKISIGQKIYLSSDTKEEFYIVQKGDTFSGIARKFNMTLNKLSGLNPDIKNINLIHVGDKIRVK